MKYYDTIDFLKIKEIILTKSKYQKLVVLMDNHTNLDFLNKLEQQIKNEVIYFCINIDFEDALEIQKLVFDGTRCVVMLLSDNNYLKTSSWYEFNNITIDIFDDNLMSLRLKENDDYYLFCKNNKLSIEDKLVICNTVIEWKWQNLIACKNYNEEEKVLLSIFNRRDLLECKQFYSLIFSKELVHVNSDYYQAYLFVRIMAIKYLFLAFFESSQKMIDIYKSYSENLEQVNFVYKLYRDERVNFVFKNCSKVMLDFINVLLSNIYLNLNLNKKEINNILNNIKIIAKNIINNNLLKYCYLYGIFENI